MFFVHSCQIIQKRVEKFNKFIDSFKLLMKLLNMIGTYSGVK